MSPFPPICFKGIGIILVNCSQRLEDFDCCLLYIEFCSPACSTLKVRYSFSPVLLLARTVLLIICYRRVRYFCYKYKASCATHKSAWRVECPMTEGLANGFWDLDYTLLSFLHRWNMLLSMYIRNSKDVWIRFEIRNLYTLLYYRCILTFCKDLVTG